MTKFKPIWMPSVIVFIPYRESLTPTGLNLARAINVLLTRLFIKLRIAPWFAVSSYLCSYHRMIDELHYMAIECNQLQDKINCLKRKDNDKN